MRNLYIVFKHFHDMICCMACVTQGQCLGRSPAHSSKHRPKHVFCKAWPITSTCCGTLSARVPFGPALIARGIAGSAGRRQRGTQAARDCAVPWDKVKPNALPDYLIEDNFRYLVEIEGSFCCLAAGVRNMCFCAICLIPWTVLLL